MTIRAGRVPEEPQHSWTWPPVTGTLWGRRGQDVEEPEKKGTPPQLPPKIQLGFSRSTGNTELSEVLGDREGYLLCTRILH